jgi:uncharacterized membrane protein YdjX (TVP38/TMEM64 family)
MLSTAVATCGAPASRPISGPLAEAVQSSLESGQATFDHSAWSRLLAEGTHEGLVDYRYFQARRADLDDYLERIATADLGALAPAELEALLINAYNALTVRTILDRPDVTSIRDIDGVWTRISHRVGGHELTLDNLEHNLLRPFFKDPRIHFALNCASQSCAPLPPWAFDGRQLDAQLDERTRSFLADEANVRVEGGTLMLSRYFDWYGDDFVADDWSPVAATIPEYVARYSRSEIAEFVEQGAGQPPVRFTDYDWSLNAHRAPAPKQGLDAATPVGSANGSGGDASGEAGFVDRLRQWVGRFGPAAPLVYGLAYVLAVVLLVPGSPLTIGAGVAFGLGPGTLVVALSATTGAALAFLIARYFARSRVERWLEGRPKLHAVDRAVAQQGWKVVALTRLSPVFPFNVQNYFYGLTAVRFWPYTVTSACTMLPGTLLYVYIGVAGAGVAAALTGAASWGRTALQIGGLLATLLVVVLITRIARKELERATRREDDVSTYATSAHSASSR